MQPRRHGDTEARSTKLIHHEGTKTRSKAKVTTDCTDDTDGACWSLVLIRDNRGLKASDLCNLWTSSFRISPRAPVDFSAGELSDRADHGQPVAEDSGLDEGHCGERGGVVRVAFRLQQRQKRSAGVVLVRAQSGDEPVAGRALQFRGGGVCDPPRA